MGAFFDCTSLKSIDLQNSIIGDYQFFMCTSLTDVTIPDNIKIIGDCAFSGCFSLTTVKLGKNVEIIGNGAFGDTKLSSITIPESVVSIGDGAFKNDNLMEIKGKFASEDHTALIIDKKLIHLADGTCKSYTSYTIPAGVEEIGSGAFLWYENLLEIIIPEGVKRIGMHGLGSCTGLTSLTLPSTITNLGNYVFLNLPKVGEIYFNSITPPNIWDVVIAGYWNPCDKGVILRVPEKSVEAYKASEWWGNYKIASFDEEIYTSTDFSQDGVVKTIQTATEGNGIDIVIMGDGYSDRQIANGKYDKDLSKALDMLFNEEPYKSLKHLFNINQVIAVSHGEEIGAGKTVFSGYLGEGTLAGGDDSKVFEYAQKAISADRVDEATIIVIMNKEHYAGTCYMYHPSKTADYGTGTSISYFPLGTNDEMLAGLICHEAGGHGFAKLGDEYAYESMGNIPSSEINNHKTQQNSWGWWKNVDFTSDPTATRWSHFINDTRYANEGLGAYEGGLTYWTGVWRPTENSIMRYNTGDFNVPSREAIYYRIHKLAYGADWEYDYEEFVEWDARNRSNSATTRGVPYKSAINKPTHPPVIVNKSWRDAK